MSALTFPMNAVVAAYGLNLLLHLTVICLGVLCAARWIFRRDPAARHYLCLTGLLCLLLAPCAVGLEARAGWGLVKLTLPGSAAAQPVAAQGDMALTGPEAPYRAVLSSALPAQPTLLWVGGAVLAVYFLGVGWGVLRFVHGCRAASRLKQDVIPWREPTDSRMLHTVEQTLHAPVPPVFTSLHVASPIAVGLLRPAVILPEGLTETLLPQQLRQVLLHECAHVTFRHGFGGLLERIVGVLFWPHPLVCLLCRELARAREEVCDNFASQEDGAACYARTLLAIAQGIDIAPNLTATLALLGTGTSLEARIAGLLDPRRNRMISLKRWKVWAVSGAAIFAVASTATIRVVAAQENAGPNPANIASGNITTVRVFGFQAMDADQAQSILRTSLPFQNAKQIRTTVNSRTNSVTVQCPGAQMTAIAALFGHLEAQAAQENAKQKQSLFAAASVATAGKQQAEAQARMAEGQARIVEEQAQIVEKQARIAEEQARSASSTTNSMHREKIQAERTKAPNLIHLYLHLDKPTAQQSAAQEAKLQAEKAARLEDHTTAHLKETPLKSAVAARKSSSLTKVTVMTPHYGAPKTLKTLYRYAVTLPITKEGRSAQTVYAYTNTSGKEAPEKYRSARSNDVYTFSPNSITVNYGEKVTFDKAVKYFDKVTFVQNEIELDNRASRQKWEDAAKHRHDNIDVKVELLPIGLEKDKQR